MIKFKDVTKNYGRVEALKGINLSIEETGFVVLRGENGSGKTTLVSLLSGIDKPSSGSIEVFGKRISEFNEKQMSEYREEYVSIVFQDDNLFDEMTVLDNLTITGKDDYFNKVIRDLQLNFLLTKKVNELSGGEKKRVAIARALLKRSKILIADEPTSSIDIDTKKLIYSVLYNYSKTALVVMISHGEDYADRLASSIIHLQSGQLLEYRIVRVNGFKNARKIYKNRFNYKIFARKNLFQNKKKLVRSSATLIIMFLLIFVAAAIAKIDIVQMDIDTAKLEKDYVVRITKPFNDPIGEDDLEKIGEDIFSNEYSYGKSIYLKDGPVMFRTEKNVADKIDKVFNVGPYMLNFHDIANVEMVDYGSYPKEAYEIVVTSYMAEYFSVRGVRTHDGTYYYPKSKEALVDEQVVLDLGGVDVTVTGIIDVDYSNFNKKKMNKYIHQLLENKTETSYLNVYVREDFFSLFEDKAGKRDYHSYIVEESTNSTLNYEAFSKPIVMLSGETVDTLNVNEVILDRNSYNEICKNSIESCVGNTITLFVNNGLTGEKRQLGDVIIRGFVGDEFSYFNRELLREMEMEKVFINNILISFDDSKEFEAFVLDKSKSFKDSYILETNYTSLYDMLSGFLEEMIIIFGIGACVLALLGLLVLSNYILDSIDIHKKDIAVLKSLGVPDNEIMRSFLLESLEVVLTSFIYSFLAFLIVRIIINVAVTKDLMFKVNITPINGVVIVGALICSIVVDIIMTKITQLKLRKLTPKNLFNKNSV